MREPVPGARVGSSVAVVARPCPSRSESAMRKTALKRIVSMSGDEGTGGCAPQPTEPNKRARRDNGSAVKASSIDPTPPMWCGSVACAPPPVEALSDEERPPLATSGSVPRPVVSVVLKGPPPSAAGFAWGQARVCRGVCRLCSFYSCLAGCGAPGVSSGHQAKS